MSESETQPVWKACRNCTTFLVKQPYTLCFGCYQVEKPLPDPTTHIKCAVVDCKKFAKLPRAKCFNHKDF